MKITKEELKHSVVDKILFDYKLRKQNGEKFTEDECKTIAENMSRFWPNIYDSAQRELQSIILTASFALYAGLSLFNHSLWLLSIEIYILSFMILIFIPIAAFSELSDEKDRKKLFSFENSARWVGINYTSPTLNSITKISDFCSVAILYYCHNWIVGSALVIAIIVSPYLKRHTHSQIENRLEELAQ